MGIDELEFDENGRPLLRVNNTVTRPSLEEVAARVKALENQLTPLYMYCEALTEWMKQQLLKGL